jgi:hypothetical protein
MSARILLPLWPHIKKYITVQYGKEMSLSNRGMPSCLLMNMLEKHKKGDPSTIKPNQRLIDDVKFLPYPVYVGDNYQRTRGLYLSSEKIIAFNESVDDMFREEMYRWCNHPNAVDNIVDYNIGRFCDQYNISEDELPFENLKRWYYRERLRLENRAKVEVERAPQLVLSY